jgi:hypothetical protein
VGVTEKVVVEVGVVVIVKAELLVAVGVTVTVKVGLLVSVKVAVEPVLVTVEVKVMEGVGV